MFSHQRQSCKLCPLTFISLFKKNCYVVPLILYEFMLVSHWRIREMWKSSFGHWDYMLSLFHLIFLFHNPAQDGINGYWQWTAHLAKYTRVPWIMEDNSRGQSDLLLSINICQDMYISRKYMFLILQVLT